VNQTLWVHNVMGVLIGVRAGNFVASELKLTVTERIVWTDSQCFLCWLKPLPVFVENQVIDRRVFHFTI